MPRRKLHDGVDTGGRRQGGGAVRSIRSPRKEPPAQRHYSRIASPISSAKPQSNMGARFSPISLQIESSGALIRVQDRLKRLREQTHWSPAAGGKCELRIRLF
jgi:hypothetical protein